LSEGTAYQLATLAPGVVYTGNPQFSAPILYGNLAAFRSNGAPAQNQITLDGSPNYALDFAVGFSPPADAVQESDSDERVRCAARFTRRAPTVNSAVKKRTNSPHGSVYYFTATRSRTATFLLEPQRSGSAGQNLHRFGGVFSGPVDIPRFITDTIRLFSWSRTNGF